MSINITIIAPGRSGLVIKNLFTGLSVCNPQASQNNRRLTIQNGLLLALFLMLCTGLVDLPAPAWAQSMVESSANRESIHYLIEGIYYLIDQNQPERAVPYFESAIELDPEGPDAYYFLGVSYHRLKRSIAHTLFYLHEADKRGVEYDRFRPNLIPEIQKQYPDVQPLAPSDEGLELTADSTQVSSQVSPATQFNQEAQIIVEGKDEEGNIVSVQYWDEIAEYPLGEPIPLAKGKRYTIRVKREDRSQLFKRLILVGSVVAVWLFR